MKKLCLFAGCLFVAFTSCQHHPTTPHPGDDLSYIPRDSANKMINSYLSSLDSTNDSNLYSVIIDADALRDYLTCEKGSKISHMKIMFAHKLSYINSGNGGRPCGYNEAGLTFILAGYDEANNYIFMGDNKVMDYGRPCPHDCPSFGTASSNVFE